jgi:hypothetical protein
MDLASVFQVIDEINALVTSNKSAMELLSTWILAVVFKKRGKKVVGIGFPSTKEKIEGTIKIEVPLFKGIAVENLEVDTMMVEKTATGHTYSKLQVVRYTYRESASTDDLFQFLVDKKLGKYPKDESLHLLVNIEQAMRFEYARLNKMLCAMEVPFANIFVVGHRGPESSLEFMAGKLYPTIEGPFPLDFRKPPPG